MSEFVQRLIRVKVKLAVNSGANQPATFVGTGGSDTVTLENHRAVVRIQNSGTPAGSEAHVDIFGMSQSLMNQLATLGIAFNVVPRNTVTIEAGTSSGMSSVFAGTIVQAYGDYNAAPNVPFHFEALSGLADSVQGAIPTVFKGSVDVATMMAGLARQMNLGFENNAVSVILSNPSYNGSYRTQMQDAARDANIKAEIIDNKLCIWPMGGNRNTVDIPLIAPPPAGEMIGYPAFTRDGIIVKTVFNPKISYGSLIKVQSSLKIVNDVGTWAVNKMDLALDSMVERGQWQQIIQAYNPKFQRPVPQQATR